MGEKIAFQITYKQHDTRPIMINGRTPFMPINGWNNNWYSYVHFAAAPINNSDGSPGGYDFSQWTATLFAANGGEIGYDFNQAPDPTSGDVLMPLDGVAGDVDTLGFRLVHPDGSQDVYSTITPQYPTSYRMTVPVMQDPTDPISPPIPLTWGGFDIAFGGAAYETIAPVEVGTGTAQVNYGYDDQGQLVSAVGLEPDGVTLRANENFGYGYDAAGNLMQRTNNTLLQTFNSDNANELLNVSENNNLLTVVGNVTNTLSSLAVNGQPATTYNDQSFAVANWVAINNGLNVFTSVVTSGRLLLTNLMSQNLPASQNLSYDLNGNLISDGLHGYSYDCANELVQVTLTNQWQIQYVYDGLGRRRIRREYAWQGGQWLNANEVHYVYDGMQVMQERSLLNTPTVTYTRGLDMSGTLGGAGGIGGLLARTDNKGSSYYHTDGNGNVSMLVDSSGNVLARYLYDSFGNTLGMWGTLATANTYRFSSKESDPRTGQYYYGYRLYDPNLQRWPNRDPIQEAGGLNLYEYVRNNPINLIDPLGLDFAGMFNGWNPYYVPPPPAPTPSGIFFFAGGELPAPGGAGAAMDYEGATFLGYNKNSGVTLGSFNCITTKGAARIGTGKESGFSSANGAYVDPANFYDAHLPLPGISPGIGDISTPNANSPYFYLQGGKGGFAGVFVGVGIDFNK